MSEAIDPAENITDEAFHTWYRQNYIKELSQRKGWRRTSRFDNTMGLGGRSQKPRWLALHEFDEKSFDGGRQDFFSLRVNLKRQKLWRGVLSGRILHCSGSCGIWEQDSLFGVT